MIVLLGHGYIGHAISQALMAQGIRFAWCHHQDNWRRLNPTSIINAAGFVGLPNVDACETAREDCVRGNILWPIQCEALAGDVPVVHVGSGCIYRGGPYTERDEPNFFQSFYSASKLAGERALAPYMEKSWLLRVRMPFSRFDHPRNLLTKLRNYSRLIDTCNSLSCLEETAITIVRFAVERPQERGIFNLTNPGSITTREIAAMMGLRKEWFASEDEFVKSVKVPRSNCTLDVRRLTSLYPLRPVQPAIQECIAALAR